MRPTLPVLALFFHFVLASADPQQNPLSSHSHHQYGPTTAIARENANLIFNSIYSSMRQWGSSIQHNGMSFYPAYVPEGTLLYHGAPNADRVIETEWLAFEIQHAEMFAISVRRKKPLLGHGDEVGDDEDVEVQVEAWEEIDLRNEPPEDFWRLGDRRQVGREKEASCNPEITQPEPHEQLQEPPGRLPPKSEIIPGYLHTYKTNRPMKLLYIDGMSAAKCNLGTMDTQDVLLLNFTFDKFRDRKRAQELCDLGREWGVEGLIRMEAGFEIIKCDFSEGLDLISLRHRPDGEEAEGYNNMFLLDYIREVSGRYGGIDGGRVELDYSSMVSAYFYPTNLSNPDQDPNRPMLPRLVRSEKQVLERIRTDLGDSLRTSKSSGGADWQGVADMIVKRYANRLQLLATDPPQKTYLSQINSILNVFVDYETSNSQDPVESCAVHYLQSLHSSTRQDRLIEAAFKTVTHKICTTLFDVRELLLEKETDGDNKDIQSTTSAVDLIRGLIKWLEWSDWKSCGQCALHEVCFIAVFPIGTAEDHYNPRCKNNTDIRSRRGSDEENYWMN